MDNSKQYFLLSLFLDSGVPPLYAASSFGIAKGLRQRNLNSIVWKIEEIIDVFKLMSDLDGSKDIETLITFILNNVLAFANEHLQFMNPLGFSCKRWIPTWALKKGEGSCYC